MNWIEVKNLQSIFLKEIPLETLEDMRRQFLKYIQTGKRLVLLFAQKKMKKQFYIAFSQMIMLLNFLFPRLIL